MANKKLPGILGIIKKSGDIFDDAKPEEQKEEVANETPKRKAPGLTREELNWKQFRHNEQSELCQWVNENRIQLQTIVADGNRLYAFYWKTVIND